MATLNRGACDAMLTWARDAATDVTGFGLLGHLRNVTRASGCMATVWLGEVPVLEAAWTYVRAGMAPGGTHANWRFLNDRVDYESAVGKEEQLILCDAQTSGGLVIALEPDRARGLLAAVSGAKVIGRLEEGPAGRAVVEAAR